MSTKREITLAQRDLEESAATILRERSKFGFMSQDAQDALEGLDASYQHLLSVRLTNGDAPASARETSIAAAKSYSPGPMEVDVLYLLARNPEGLTCEQLEASLTNRRGVPMKHQTVSARVNRLEDIRYIRDSGEKRRNTSRRLAIVWKITTDGIDHLAGLAC